MGNPHARAIILAILICSSCSPNDGVERHRFRTTRDQGIEIATNTGGPAYAGEIFKYEPVQYLKSDAEIPESYLFRPGAIIIDDEGFYYVCENGGRRIVVFDPDGIYVRSFGGQGSGPGEFQSIALIGWTDDLLTFYDVRLRRATVYSTNGVLSGVYTQPLASSGRLFFPADNGLSVILDLKSERRELDSWQAMQSVVINADGDTISVQQPLKRPFQRSLRDPDVAFVWSFNTYARIIYRPGEGIVVYDAENPELNWYSLSGELIRRIDVGLPRIDVSIEQKNELRRYWDERIGSAEGQAKREMKAVRDNLAFGDFNPYWNNFFIDDAGYYWLETFETYQQKQDAGGVAFRVLSADGEYIGDTRWPAQVSGSYMIQYPLVSRGHLVAMVTDPETEDRIPTVFKIIPIAEDLEYP